MNRKRQTDNSTETVLKEAFTNIAMIMIGYETMRYYDEVGYSCRAN